MGRINFRGRGLFIVAATLLLIFEDNVYVFAAQSHDAKHGVTHIDEFNECRDVGNSGSDVYFIPTNSKVEWDWFISAAQNQNSQSTLPGISLATCAPPPPPPPPPPPLVAVNCVGGWGACSKTCGGGLQVFSVVTPAKNGGVACAFGNGATLACNPQACASGHWVFVFGMHHKQFCNWDIINYSKQIGVPIGACNPPVSNFYMPTGTACPKVGAYCGGTTQHGGTQTTKNCGSHVFQCQ